MPKLKLFNGVITTAIIAMTGYSSASYAAQHDKSHEVTNKRIVITKPLKFDDRYYSKKSVQSIAPVRLKLDSQRPVVNTYMTGAESLKPLYKFKPLPTSIHIKSGDMLSLAVIKQLDKYGYNPIWMLNDKTAKSLNSKATENIELNTSSIYDFSQSVASKLTELGGQKVYVKVYPETKQVVFHLYGSDNVALFNMKAGRLSTNIENAAKQFGWKLDQKRGWLATQDYPISVDFPIVAENNIDAVLTKILLPYETKVNHKLVSSIKEVFVVDAK